MRAFTLSLSGLALAGLLLTAACSSSDDDKDPVPGVMPGIEIPESTVKDGELPATSVDELAPVLEAGSGNLITTPGGQVIVTPTLVEGDAVGFYLRVEGYNSSIYDITSTEPEINGRTKDSNPYFIIRFHESFTPQEVCVKFAVYDNAKRVSNYITECITVKTAGGAGSDFLTAHAWKASKTIDHSNQLGFDIEKIIGQLYTEDVEAGINCDGIPTNVTAEIAARTNYKYLTLAANGTLTQDESFYTKTVDLASSNCTPAYQEKTGTLTSTGVWIYESETTTLTLFITNSSGSAVYTYEVIQQDGTLVLRQSSAVGEYSETHYVSK